MLSDSQGGPKINQIRCHISAEDIYGCTPLSPASDGPHLKDRSVVRLLLCGADVEAENSDGETALQVVGEVWIRDDVTKL